MTNDTDTGELAIDGADVRQFDPRSVREQIAAVLEAPLLFSSWCSMKPHRRWTK